MTFAQPASALIGGVGKFGRKSLVLLELTGGNDALSMLVPFADDAYRQARPKLRWDEEQVLGLDAAFGLNPGLKGLHETYKRGELAVIHGAGYPESKRSHFKAMDVWHSGDVRGRMAGEGWVGRLARVANWSKDPSTLIHVGKTVPFSLLSHSHTAVSFEAPGSYQWAGSAEQQKAFEDFSRSTKTSRQQAKQSAEASGKSTKNKSMLEALRGVCRDADRSSDRIRAAVLEHPAAVRYPRTRLGAALQNIAAVQKAQVGARVFSLAQKGFDTHRNQSGAHTNLMRDLDQALAAFQSDLEVSSAADDTIVVVYSEFGRRLAENGSGGTDHGKAGSMLVLGKSVRGGQFGEPVSLTKLLNGDPAPTTDFRSVFGTVVDRWMGANHAEVFGSTFPALDFLAKRV